MKLNTKFKGYFLVFISVLFFSFMTLIVKLITKNNNIPGVEVTFFRFLIGFIIIYSIKSIKKKKIVPVNKKALWARAILNTLAVILFFVTIQLSTVTKANIYNLTYPIFVAIFAPFFLDEKLTLKKAFIVLLALIGTYLVVGFNFKEVGLGDITGILGGVVAGFAIISLRKARLTDESFTILYYLMKIGLVITFFSFVWFFKIPSVYELLLLVSVGAVSFLGQFFITEGYKYISALGGSILSSSRIFVAAILSIIFLGELLKLNVIIGGTLIFLSVVLINLGTD
ncbi:DMT family transporter [Haliovirga abyssi]|uniref:Choline transporter n=1 Tax=Haliovirga abyssi TaxID=2996794 RepID=A0AAU9DJH5_9FUSO|nr:DMT family transporter [Haliovirga abyssi]BDU50999.1 choline transporter [Haliovirga abyssi]